MTAIDLEALFERYRREGDLRALGEAFDRTAEELLRVARHLAKDEADAEDLVQATYLAAIEHADRFDAGRGLVPWLAGILTNKAKLARALSLRRPDPDRLQERAGEDPALDAEMREFVQALETALDRVPESYRQILRSHLANGMKPEAIAREIDRPPGTVRVQLHRGLQQLRKWLPASFALGGLAVSTSPRGIAAIRAQILGHAGRVAAATSGSAAASVTVGGMLMGKKVALAIGLAAIASGLVWFRTPRRPNADVESHAPSAETVTLPAATREVESPAQSPVRTPADSMADSSSTSREFYGSLEMQWTWADGTPAAGIGVGAAARAEPDYYDHAVFGTTDANGRIVFERLREGPIYVYTPRDSGSEQRETSVTAGHRTSERFSIPSAEDVYGLVIDADGHPVANAEIHISPQLDDGGSVEARSSQAGSYFVRAVPKGTSLFATAEGRGSSLLASLRDLDPEGKGEIQLDLVLQGESSAVRGSVLDPEGKPVVGAWITLHGRRMPDDPRRRDWPAIWTTTDPEGSFRIVGADKGRADLEVLASGFAVESKEIDLEEDRTSELVIRLEPGFTVQGTARTSDGAPVAGATIHRGPASVAEGYHSWSHGIRTRTESDGRYELQHVPSGDAELHAELRGEGSLMRDSGRRAGRVGDVVNWDPVLKEGSQIRGRIVDDVGGSLAGWTIAGMPESRVAGTRVPTSKSDASGAFVLTDCGETTYTLRAFPPSTSISQIARVIEKGVRAGDNVVLVAPHAWEEGGWITGKVTEEDGAVLRGASVFANHRESGQSSSARANDSDGSFKIGPLPAGHYIVHVYPKDLPGIVVSVPEELLPPEVRNIGTIRARPRGRFELHLTMSDGSAVETPFILLREGIVGYPVEGTDGSQFRNDKLYAGTYTLVVNGARIATLERQVEIRAGESTLVEVTASAGTVQDIRFVTPGKELAPEQLTIVFRKADGSKILEEEASSSLAPDGRRFRMFHGGFPPGTYTFEATSAEGWTASGAFEIPQGNETTKMIEAPLVRR